MFKKLKISLVILASLNLSLIALPVKTYALFDGSKGQACAGVNLTNRPATCDPKGSADSLNHTIGVAINFLSFAVGLIAVIMLIVGGIKFALAGGDSNSANNARNTVFYALIGLAIAVLAQIIVHFVLFRLEKP